jgi:hypothetical protein
LRAAFSDVRGGDVPALLVVNLELVVILEEDLLPLSFASIPEENCVAPASS